MTLESAKAESKEEKSTTDSDNEKEQNTDKKDKDTEKKSEDSAKKEGQLIKKEDEIELPEATWGTFTSGIKYLGGWKVTAGICLMTCFMSIPNEYSE